MYTNFIVKTEKQTHLITMKSEDFQKIKNKVRSKKIGLSRIYILETNESEYLELKEKYHVIF